MGITRFDMVQANAFLGPMEALGAGNIYYVCQSANTSPYNRMVARYGGQTYEDGTQLLHTTIQSALDATVANRNDYVIVMPDSSDYDITAALTMTKARTHLICPAGLGYQGFPPNMVRIHQNTAATDFITVTADTIEIAGFFFKQDSTSRANLVYLSGTRWHPHIHDNFFGMSATASTANYGIYGDGAVSHCSIHDNYFTNYNPGAMTGTDNDIAAFIGLTAGGSTRGLIYNNHMTTGHNTAVATMINVAGANFMIINNYLYETKAFGASQTGTMTVGINTSADCFVADNKIGLATAANAVVGGTADESYVTNYEASAGGTAAT